MTQCIGTVIYELNTIDMLPWTKNEDRFKQNRLFSEIRSVRFCPLSRISDAYQRGEEL